VTATEKLTGLSCAETAKYGAQAAGQRRTARLAGRACPEAAAAVETLKTATGRRMADGKLSGCEAAIRAADAAFGGKGLT
jgi:hypothetical protein